MNWISLLCVTWSLVGFAKAQAQQGYNYDRPSRPFSPSQQQNFQNQPGRDASQPQPNNQPSLGQNQPPSNGYPSRSNVPEPDQENYPDQPQNAASPQPRPQTNGFRPNQQKPRPFQPSPENQQPGNGFQSQSNRLDQQNGGALRPQPPKTNGFGQTQQPQNRFNGQPDEQQGYPTSAPISQNRPQNGFSNNFQAKPQQPNQGQSTTNQGAPKTSSSYPNQRTPNQSNGFKTATTPGQSRQPQNDLPNNFQTSPQQSNQDQYSDSPSTINQGSSTTSNQRPQGQNNGLGPQQPGRQNQYSNSQRNQDTAEDGQANPDNDSKNVPIDLRSNQAPPAGKEFVNEDESEGSYDAIPGEPDVDYPIYSEIPQTAFKCDQQQYPGYYADVEARCQVFHICTSNQMYDFLCPNGTIFHQEYLVCVWWNQFDCNSATSLYGINAYIYGSNETENRFSQEGQAGNTDSNQPGRPTAEEGNSGSQNGEAEPIDTRDPQVSRKNGFKPTKQTQQPADSTQTEYQPTEPNGYSGSRAPQTPNRSQTSPTNGFKSTNGYPTSKTQSQIPDRAKTQSDPQPTDSNRPQSSNGATTNGFRNTNGYSQTTNQQQTQQPNGYSPSRNGQTKDTPPSATRFPNRQQSTNGAGFSRTTPNLPTTYQPYQPQPPQDFNANQGQSATPNPEEQSFTSRPGGASDSPQTRFSPGEDKSRPQPVNGRPQSSNTGRQSNSDGNGDGYRYNQPEFGLGGNLQQPSRGYLPPFSG